MPIFIGSGLQIQTNRGLQNEHVSIPPIKRGSKMKRFKSIIRYYTVYCICQFLIIVWDQKFAINQFSTFGIVFLALFIAPLHTIFMTAVHYFKINRKVFGNIVLEIITSILPSFIIGTYSLVVFHFTDNWFDLNDDDNSLYRKWYLDDTNIAVMAYIVFFIMLFIHGRIKIIRGVGKGESNCL